MRAKYPVPGRGLRGVAASLALTLLSSTLACHPASAQSINEALAAAYKNNPRLDADRARQRATDEEVARANSGYRPSINATGEIGYQRTDTSPATTTNGESHPKGYAITGSQPIFRGFRTLNNVRRAEATVRAGREALRLTEQDVLLAAATAYMDVVRDQAIVRLRENNVNVLTRELKATQDRFSVGEVTRTDVAQAQARRAVSVSELDAARAALRTSRAAFEAVVGFPPRNLTDQRPPESKLPKSLPEALAITMREYPRVVNALYNEQAARHNVDLIWGELLPTVSLDARYQRSFDTSRTIDEAESTTVTGRVTVPIYDQGGEVHARVRQAKHTHVQSLQVVEQERADAQSRATSAWSSYQAAKAQLESDRSQVAATRTALAGVREEERVGQRTLLDVLNAENEALNAEVRLVTTQRNLVVAGYALLSAIGRLSAAETGVVGQAYDPDVHYHEIRRKWWGISITRSDGRREVHDMWETHGVKYEENRLK
jgi:outer membrane protein